VVKETRLKREQRIKALLNILEDVVQDKETLKKEQQNMQALIESLHDGVVVFGADLKIMLVNNAFLQMCDTKADQVTIATVADVFSQSQFSERLYDVMTTGTMVLGEEWSDNGSVFQASIVPVKTAGVQVVGAALILHDITHLKEVDRMKTEFVSLASHQLRTPLTATKLFTEMLFKGYGGELTDQQGKYLEKIKSSTERMVRLVGDLLNVSRLESGEFVINPKPIDLQKLIKEEIEQVEIAHVKKGCKITYSKPKVPLGKISLDPMLMRQIVSNLLTNAIQYSKKPCKVMLGLSIVKSSRAAKKPDQIKITVKDNGIGIPLKAQAQLFKKFYRADNARKAVADGSGLGLYVVKMILDACEGKIWFETVLGKGTKFYVTFPLRGMKPKKGTKYLSTQN
jgi:signal transduction histidine kinase